QLEKDGAVVAAEDFDPSTGIVYEGLNIQIKGQITKGDSITLEPRETFSIFDTFKEAAEQAEHPVSDASATAKLHQVTEEFHAAFIHLTKARTDVGARLNTLDIQEQQHEDFKLSLAKAKSNFEDLDYSKAIIEFNENSRALQASQQAFGKTKDLTLFNYI
ncbi:flagellin, partial [Vibrio kanaloae]